MAALSRNRLLLLLLPSFLCSNLLVCCYAARKMDILHANWSINGVIAGIVGLILGKPVLTTLRGSDVNLMETSALMRRLVHFCLRFSNVVVTVSPSLQQKLTERFPQYRAKIGVICNGIDQAFFAAEDIQEEVEEGCSASGQGKDLSVFYMWEIWSLVKGWILFFRQQLPCLRRIGSLILSVTDRTGRH